MARRGLDKGKLTKEKKSTELRLPSGTTKTNQGCEDLYNGLGLGKDPPAYALLLIFPIDIDPILSLQSAQSLRLL
jgi:hypothetical protein